MLNLGGIATREITKKKNLKGLSDNIKIAKRGGKIASNTRKDLENELGESVVTSENMLNYKYIDETEKLEIK